MKVYVLGAAIVGLATAYMLRQQGCDVTVVDKASPGSGTSGGNGGFLLALGVMGLVLSRRRRTVGGAL